MILYKTRKKLFHFSIYVYTLLLIWPSAGQAEGVAGCSSREDSDSGIWNNIENCRKCGDCSLNDFAQLALNIFDYILGLVGSLALLVFVYGGILFLFSGGNSDQVQKGKSALKGAVIGLIIVFCSYVIVHFVSNALQ